ncbi:MAG: hypothetical protein ACFCU4_05130 [Puniceicoccaceae bacterium]
MTKSILILLATVLPIGSTFAASSSETKAAIEDLRQQIHRQEQLLAILKQELARLEEDLIDPPITIMIGENGFRFNDQPLTAEDLQGKMDEIPEDVSVLIMADPRVSFNEVQFVLALLSDRGISNLSIKALKDVPVGYIDEE